MQGNGVRQSQPETQSQRWPCPTCPLSSSASSLSLCSERAGPHPGGNTEERVRQNLLPSQPSPHTTTFFSSATTPNKWCLHPTPSSALSQVYPTPNMWCLHLTPSSALSQLFQTPKSPGRQAPFHGAGFALEVTPASGFLQEGEGQGPGQQGEVAAGTAQCDN